VPTELMLYFKSLVAIEGLGRKIDKDFDFLSYSLQFAGELIKLQYEPNKMMQDFAHLARESRSLINQLPRQLAWLMKRMNSPEYASKIEIKDIESLKYGLEISFNLLFLGLIIGCLLISASLVVTHPTENLIAGIPTLSFIGYAGALVLGIVAFFNYIKK
jgi:ubiquinone biosynthesis protein